MYWYLTQPYLVDCIFMKHFTIMHCVYFLIAAAPSAPEPFVRNCTDITYQSFVLLWDPPSDNGGEYISHYSVTGTPDDISNITDDTVLPFPFPILTPNTVYTFNISANNSVGFGEELSIECTTPGEGEK